MKKGQIVGLFVEFPPRSLTWQHDGQTKKVVASAEAVEISQQKDQQHNPIHTTIGFAIEEFKEHGGSDVVTSGSFFSLDFAGPR